MEFADGIQTFLEDPKSPNRTCARSTGYIRDLYRKHIWPFSVSSQKNSLLALLTEVISEPVGNYCPSMCGGKTHGSYSFGGNWLKMGNKVMKNIGVCLDCVETGRESFRSGKCCIKHT